MLIYNVTVKIEPSIQKDWVKWMKEVHIPDVMGTGLFVENKLCRLLLDETDGITYAVQYSCIDMAAFQQYQTLHAKRLQTEHTERYKNRYVAFRTMMEVID